LYTNINITHFYSQNNHLSIYNDVFNFYEKYMEYIDMNLHHNYESNEPKRKYRNTENSIEERKVAFDPEEHSMNIHRRIMERGDMFNADTRINPYKPHYIDQNGGRGRQFPTSNRFGEITGEALDTADMEQGMPMRPAYNSKLERVSDVDQQHQSHNPTLDFNLYDSKPTMNVSYYDPSVNRSDPSNNYADVNGDSQLLNPTERIDSLKYFATTSNLFSWNLLSKFPKSSVALSPFSILNPIVLLYRGSHGSTEQELRQSLFFQPKDITFDSINRLSAKIFTSPSMIGSSLVLTPGSIQINQAFAQYVKNIGQINPFNLSRPIEEISRINSIVSQYTKSTIKNMIGNDTKLINENTNIILLTTAYFRGKFEIPFNRNNVQQFTFKGLRGDRYVSMLRQRDTVHRYYEDNEHQIIELDYIDGEFAMGVILPLNSSRLNVSHEMYEYYVSQLMPTNIGSLAIPKFQQSSKFKIDNIFKSMGMIETFMNADFSEITPSNEVMYVSDIIHQSVITVEESDGNVRTPKPIKTSRSSRDFIANHPFIYYIRYLPVNVVVLNGYYC